MIIKAALGFLAEKGAVAPLTVPKMSCKKAKITSRWQCGFAQSGAALCMLAFQLRQHAGTATGKQ
jgi:hypothetical protein